MKPITEVDSKKLKESATALNATGVLAEKIRTVGVSKLALCEAFVDAIDNLDDAVREQLATDHTEIVVFYNELIADEAGEEPEAVEPESAEVEPEAVEPEPEPAPAPAARGRRAPAAAPAAPAEPAAETPAPAARGRARTPAAAPAVEEPVAEPAPAPRGKRAAAPAAAPAQPAKPAKKPAAAAPAAAPQTVAEAAEKKKPGPMANAERTSLGHIVGTMSGTIDTLLLEGATEEVIIKALQKDFGRDYGHAKNKFKAHFKYLQKYKGITINTSEAGVHKIATGKKAPAAAPKKKAAATA